VKYFHGISAGNTHECSLKSRIGEVRFQRLFAHRGTPKYVKSDHGPKFIAQRVTAWLPAHHVDTHCIAPGSPWQNGHNERFNGVFRDGGLNRWLFAAVQEARRIINHWREEYNHERPYGETV
jgi:putative transposase